MFYCLELWTTRRNQQIGVEKSKGSGDTGPQRSEKNDVKCQILKEFLLYRNGKHGC